MRGCARVRLVLGTAVVAVVAGATTSALGQATFQPLFDSASPPRGSNAFGVSGDGSVVVGWVQVHDTTSWPLAARWPVVGGPPEVVTEHEGKPVTRGYALAASWSGVVVAGYADSGGRSWAFTWTGSGFDWVLYSAVRDVTADGTLMCGRRAGGLSAVWRIGEEPTYLPTPAGFDTSEASRISGEGGFIAGYADQVDGWGIPRVTRAVVWRRVGTAYTPSVLPAGQYDTLAYGISPDGTVVVGFDSGGAYWKRGEGPISIRPASQQFSGTLAASRRGARMVGSVGAGTGHTDAWFWSAQGESRMLKEMLETDYGLDLTGWRLSSANAISDDGTVIVGSGTNPQGRDQGWRLVLPLPCASDWNFDGVVNSTDVSDMINDWFLDQEEGTFASDVDGNGVVNSADVSEYINGWFVDAKSCG